MPVLRRARSSQRQQHVLALFLDGLRAAATPYESGVLRLAHAVSHVASARVKATAGLVRVLEHLHGLSL